jgi:hypothetical protein
MPCCGWFKAKRCLAIHPQIFAAAQNIALQLESRKRSHPQLAFCGQNGLMIRSEATLSPKSPKSVYMTSRLFEALQTLATKTFKRTAGLKGGVRAHRAQPLGSLVAFVLNSVASSPPFFLSPHVGFGELIDICDNAYFDCHDG